MSINLQKGQKIDLTKASDRLQQVMVSLSWDEVPGASIDCDASVILCGADGKLLNDSIGSIVYFKNLNWNGAVVHQGDNRTGSADEDAERIMVDLEKVPVSVCKIVFVVNIYDAKVKNQHFGMIENAFIRIVNLKTGAEVCRYDLSEDYSGMTGMIAGELVRENGGWLFHALGEPVKDASRLSAIVALYR